MPGASGERVERRGGGERGRVGGLVEHRICFQREPRFVNHVV